MLLCSACSEIDLEALTHSEGHRLGKSYYDMERSASSCELCAALYGTLNQTIQDPDYPIALHRKRHNPNYPDKHGYSEIVARPYLPPHIKYNYAGPISTPDVTLGVAVEPDSLPATQNIISGRVVPPFPNTLECFDGIYRWIDGCLANHETCETTTTFPLPKRVIDVGLSEETTDPFLYESQGEEGTWVTLSCKWGNGVNPLLTKTASLDERKKCIKFDLLPQALQDAVTVTRNLGVQYLWIDSICIIQDSREDWADQSQKMAEIFSHSLLTIAACEPDDCHSGFLKPRKYVQPFQGMMASSIDTIETRYILPSSGEEGRLWIRPALQPYKFVMQPSGPLDYLDLNKLGKRGWVLQETLLSPRTLHYTREQVMWQCRTHAFAESDVEEVEFNYWPTYEWQNDKALLYRGLPDPLAIARRSPDGFYPPKEYYSLHTNWLRIVDKFVTRRLTYSRDTLPAISGIAAEVRRLTNDRYLAGIWFADFARGLLWDDCESTPSAESRAPSWSWASRDAVLPRARYPRRFYAPPEPKSTWQPYLKTSSAITMNMPSQQSVSLVNYTNVGDASNEFGTASITLSAPYLIEMPKEVDSAAETDGLVTSYIRDMTLKSQFRSTLALCENHGDNKLDQCTGNISHVLIAFLRDYRNEESYYWALAVRRDEGSTKAEGCYKRSGILKFDEKSLHGRALWHRREVTIV